MYLSRAESGKRDWGGGGGGGGVYSTRSNGAKAVSVGAGPDVGYATVRGIRPLQWNVCSLVNFVKVWHTIRGYTVVPCIYRRGGGDRGVAAIFSSSVRQRMVAAREKDPISWSDSQHALGILGVQKINCPRK